MDNKQWWKESIIYQIYPRSFKDTTGSGIGDLYGVIKKLDYIKSLGVDIIWLCPVYKSPNHDNGYDIADYYTIAEDFGGNAAFDKLLTEIHKRGLKLIIDLVVNHTSYQHDWFKKSAENETNPYRNFYYWKKGNPNKPPNNWKSFFGGTSWTYSPQTASYYLHLFTKEQPDLNWENPEVRKAIYEVMHYWCKKGIDGFRMDVVSLISKNTNFPNTKTDNFPETIKTLYANGPRVHEFLNEMNREVLSKYNVMTVGEGPGIDLDNTLDYVGHRRNELNMIFHFGHMFMDQGAGGKYDPIEITLPKIKAVFNQWDEKLKDKGWGSIFLGNHDFSRMVSKFGNDKAYHQESAKLLAILLLTLRGTVYLYQGDEIGMTNVAYPDISYYNDVETLNAWKEAEEKGADMEAFLKLVHQQSRDNARTPMQWKASNHAGFTTGTPWLQVNENYKTINVEDAIQNPYSILNFYKKVIAYRKSNPSLVYANYHCFNEKNEHLFYYKRWDSNNLYLVILNFSNETYNTAISGINLNNFSLDLSNYLTGTTHNFKLRPWEAKVFKAIIK